MDSGFLIAGGSSELFSSLVREALSAGGRVVATAEGGEQPVLADQGFDDRLRHVTWNQRSPLSARSVVVQGDNAFSGSGVDEAIVVFSQAPARQLFHETAAATIEQAVDRAVKAQLFLLKELVTYFLKRGRGSLSVAIEESSSQDLAPLDACTAGAVLALSKSLFDLYQNEPITLRGFRGSSGDPQGFAAYILETIREKGSRASGKWFRHGSKSSIFSFGR